MILDPGKNGNQRAKGIRRREVERLDPGLGVRKLRYSNGEGDGAEGSEKSISQSGCASRIGGSFAILAEILRFRLTASDRSFTRTKPRYEVLDPRLALTPFKLRSLGSPWCSHKLDASRIAISKHADELARFCLDNLTISKSASQLTHGIEVVDEVRIVIQTQCRASQSHDDWERSVMSQPLDPRL